MKWIETARQLPSAEDMHVVDIGDGVLMYHILAADRMENGCFGSVGVITGHTVTEVVEALKGYDGDPGGYWWSVIEVPQQLA